MKDFPEKKQAFKIKILHNVVFSPLQRAKKGDSTSQFRQFLSLVLFVPISIVPDSFNSDMKLWLAKKLKVAKPGWNCVSS